jgi:hypothetical protein
MFTSRGTCVDRHEVEACQQQWDISEATEDDLKLVMDDRCDIEISPESYQGYLDIIAAMLAERMLAAIGHGARPTAETCQGLSGGLC